MSTLLKALDLSGHWDRAVSLYEWLTVVGGYGVKLNGQVIELMARILGRESQCRGPVVRCRSHPGLLGRCTGAHFHLTRIYSSGQAIELFERMKEMVINPTLVTYNVMLDVYGKMGRSWDKIVGLLDEMRSKGLGFDEFTCGTVISACGREVFGKAGFYSEALSVLKEMEESNCPPDSVTYNELVGAYLRAEFYEEAGLVMEKIISKGGLPNAIKGFTLRWTILCSHKRVYSTN